MCRAMLCQAMLIWSSLLDDLGQSIHNDKTSNFFEVSKGSAGKLEKDINL